MSAGSDNVGLIEKTGDEETLSGTMGRCLRFGGPITAGEIIKLVVSYPMHVGSAVEVGCRLVLFYKDSFGNIYKQQLRPFNNLIGESVKSSYKEWDEAVGYRRAPRQHH